MYKIYTICKCCCRWIIFPPTQLCGLCYRAIIVVVIKTDVKSTHAVDSWKVLESYSTSYTVRFYRLKESLMVSAFIGNNLYLFLYFTFCNDYWIGQMQRKLYHIYIHTQKIALHVVFFDIAWLLKVKHNYKCECVSYFLASCAIAEIKGGGEVV